MAVPKGYKILSGGEGGSFAKVYEVRHIELGYVRAIRELKDPIVANNEEELKKNDIYKKFLRETKTLLNLGNGSHPNIESINTFGTFQDPGCPSENIAYWERSYIQGDNLEEFLDKSGKFVSVEEVIRMAEQISSALAYCHEDAYRFLMNPNDKEDKLPEGCVVGSIVEDLEIRKMLIDKYKVIHNDIHLKNILRRIDGNYLLIDFGMAVKGKEAPTLSRCHGGAEISRAPELWDSDSRVKPTTQTDVYSFGVVLYALLAGRSPFTNKDELMYAHRHLDPPPIEPIRKKFFEERFPGQTYKRDYPQWLEDAIMKCLEKDPAKRFRNGKELYEFIKGHCQDANNAKYEMEIGKLASENKLLRLQVKDLRDTNAALNRQLNSTQNMLNQTQQTLRDTQDRLEKIRHQSNKSRIPLWILLILFGLWGLAASLYSWNNRPTELNRQLEEKNQAIASANDEINELKSTITDLQNGVDQSVPNTGESAEITRLTHLIAERDQKISSLEDQLSMQKPSDNSAEITRLNNIIKQKDQKIQDFELRLSQQKSADNTAELKRLNNEVTGLNNSIKQKDQKIQNLESTIKDKDKEIKALNDVIAGKTNK